MESTTAPPNLDTSPDRHNTLYRVAKRRMDEI